MTNANITADELWAEKSTVRNKACVSPPQRKFQIFQICQAISMTFKTHSSVLKMQRKTKYIYKKIKHII